MDTSTTSIFVGNVLMEILNRQFGDVQFELAPAIASGVVVGACTVAGSLLMGGRIGALIGGFIGSGITTYIGPRIVTLRQVVNDLNEIQLQPLVQNIRQIITSLLGMAINSGLELTRVLETHSNNSEVRLHIIGAIADFLRNIHGDRLSLRAA